MGRPLMLQDTDDARIEALEQRLGAGGKIGVVRSALDLLEREAERAAHVERWRRAVRAVAAESGRVNRDFQRHSCPATPEQATKLSRVALAEVIGAWGPSCSVRTRERPCWSSAPGRRSCLRPGPDR